MTIGLTFVRLSLEMCVSVCKKIGSLLVHHVGDIRVSASRQNLVKRVKVMQHVLWWKVGAGENFGVSASVLKRTMEPEQEGFATVPDEKLVKYVFSLLGLR